MKNIQKITKDLYYIGASDRKISLFEAVYPLTNGMSYNSYLLVDDKTVLFDTVDKSRSNQFFENLEYLLKDKTLDYFVINHLEPDHSALIKQVLEKYKNVKIVCNQKIKQMLFQFFEFDFDIEDNFLLVKENDTISTANHELMFMMAPMVHWPEVMVTYDKKDKILFSADAFGTFGALNGNIFDDEINFDEKISEYRRYYSNIVGKYGQQVQMLLNKAKNIDIKMLCPLHGYMIRENVSKIVNKYDLWSKYIPEEKSVLIAYASVYGGTQNGAEILANKLAQNGIKNIQMFDVSTMNHSYILAEAFKYSHIVIATPTYNNCIFVKMEQFLNDIVNHNLLNRTFAIIENGSWACNCGIAVKTILEKLKTVNFIENKVTIKSTLKANQEEELDCLAKEIVEDVKKEA